MSCCSCTVLHARLLPSEMCSLVSADYLTDFMGVDLPAVVQWPSYTDATAFVDIYDWDLMMLDLTDGLNMLQFHLILCTGIFPCSLTMSATGVGTIQRSANGSLSCSASLGCYDVSFNSVYLLCDRKVSQYPAVEMVGAKLTIVNSTFDGCASANDGGAVQAYGTGSTSLISDSTFRNCHSESFGGAVSMVGGHHLLQNTTFEYCSSNAGGGAVSAAEYSCYGSRGFINTTVDVYGCSFVGCHSDGDGGGILLTAAEGTVVSSLFISCQSSLSGGAVSAGTQSRLKVQNSSFQSNTAEGAGGGALHARAQTLTFGGLSCRGNQALNGGGGALFLETDLQPIGNNSHLKSDASASFELGCVPGSCNLAAYGPCLATSYSALEVFGLPTHSAPAYPGLSFSVTVIKKDSYNQTITSDSNSIIKAQSTLNVSSLGNDGAMQVVSVGVAEVVGGEAGLSIALRPFFTWHGGKAELASKPSLVFSGVDAQTGGTMQATSAVAFASGVDVCPTGYVLLFDNAESASAGEVVSGYCSLCGTGTYSLNPLAGTSQSSLPACLDCLAGATCLGGSSIALPVGFWTVSSWAYRLVGCPRGHQLVNSVAGVFSYTAQACVACGIDEYIVNPNSSLVACQACPVGAVCDGASLQSRVSGALWVADAETGLYTLMSCPPGYERDGIAGGGDQQCQSCPAAYFCIGGAAPAEPCADGSFALPGANSSRACTPVSYVDVQATLPLALAALDVDEQGRFAEALGDTCGVLPSQIVIRSIQALRRSAVDAIQVEARIAAPDAAAAAVVAAKIDNVELSAQLARQGLPSANIQSVTVQPEASATAAFSNAALAGLAGLVALVVLLAVLLVRLYAQKPAIDEEARLELERIDTLRRRLSITPADGFVIGSERVPMWRKHGLATVQIRRQHVEAAVRLGAMHEFDLDQFDAFCVLLRQQPEASMSDSSTCQYDALCKWLLEVSEALIRPDIEEINAGNSSKFTVGVHGEAARARFDYFRHRYCSLRHFNIYFQSILI